MQSIFPISIHVAQFSTIECVPAPSPITVQVVDPEFSSVCPKSGLPDFAKLVIRYVPGEHVAELKSLKLYLRDYYGVGIFHEEATKRIANDIVEAIKPKELMVIGHWNARGGVHTVTEAHYVEGEGWIAELAPSDVAADVAADWNNR